MRTHSLSLAVAFCLGAPLACTDKSVCEQFVDFLYPFEWVQALVLQLVLDLNLFLQQFVDFPFDVCSLILSALLNI